MPERSVAIYILPVDETITLYDDDDEDARDYNNSEHHVRRYLRRTYGYVTCDVYVCIGSCYCVCVEAACTAARRGAGARVRREGVLRARTIGTVHPFENRLRHFLLITGGERRGMRGSRSAGCGRRKAVPPFFSPAPGRLVCIRCAAASREPSRTHTLALGEPLARTCLYGHTRTPRHEDETRRDELRRTECQRDVYDDDLKCK